MKRKTQLCVAAFAVTGILILALCGFVAVDLSTDRYMPGQFSSLLEIVEAGDGYMRVAIFGNRYRIDPSLLDAERELLWEYRGLLPPHMGVVANLTVQGYLAAKEYADENRLPEEPW